MPSTKKKKKNKKKGTGHGHFCPLNSPIFSLQFSFHFGEKTFWYAREENTRAPSNQTHSKKFSFSFSPKLSIHSISPPNKHTLSQLESTLQENLLRTIENTSHLLCNQTHREIKIPGVLYFSPSHL